MIQIQATSSAKFFSRHLIFTLLLGLSLELSSCSYYRSKDSQNLSSLPVSGIKVSYQMVHDKVFNPSCISCHGSSGGVNLESYASVIQNIKGVENTVFVRKTMPKGRTLGDEELNILAAWIRAGAPENAETSEAVRTTPDNTNEGTPSPTEPSPSPGPSVSPDPSVPPESTEPLKPFFNSIKRVIFEPRCFSCHSSGGSASGVPLQTWKDLLDSPRELVLPGNPDESGLVIAITREDSRRMPPTGSGAQPLSQNEISIIRAWISAGAPERPGQVRPSPSPSPRPTPSVAPSSLPSPHPSPLPIPSIIPSPAPSASASPERERLMPTFTSIKRLIFELRCISCHQDGGTASDIPLLTRNDLLDSPRDLVLPGNADESGLYIAVSRQDSKRMPPPQEVESQALSEVEIQLIRKWILEGAIE